MSEANEESDQPDPRPQEAAKQEPVTAAKRKASGQDGTGLDEREKNKRRKGVAPVREEYLVKQNASESLIKKDSVDDDAAEASHHRERAPIANNSKKRQKTKGQNTNRKFGKSQDDVRLCSTRIHAPEFSPEACSYGDKCRFEHDIRNYLEEHKREDLTTFSGECPVWQLKKVCPAGWKCRFVGSHSKEVEREDGRKELVLVVDEAISGNPSGQAEDAEAGNSSSLAVEKRIALTRRKIMTPKADAFLKWLENASVKVEKPEKPEKENGNDDGPSLEQKDATAKEDNRAMYREPPFRPCEKRRLYFDASTPVLAPLTTQGNLPFRRLCTGLGATFTYSEMAMSLPLIQGQRSEWALIKAHESELEPPTLTNKDTIVQNYPSYNPNTDIRFAAQIAANKPWVATKATEVLTSLLPPTALRCIDLNVGCPIDLVFREGAGSALLDSPSKLCKILQSMNACSGPVPITCKIRMGTKDGKPTAHKLVERLILGTDQDTPNPYTPAGIAALTLHGRSRQQRYTRNADWEYIASTAALIKHLNAEAAAATDTAHAPDERDLPASASSTSGLAPVFFLGNGDCYTPEAYRSHIASSGVDSVMIGRAALQKPWIFEEIAAGQQLDKSASERLAYVEQFCRYGLEAWGSDEWGVGATRRFLLEWLSFACRYVPVGLLERVETDQGDGGWGQPSIQDRAPAYRGRNELETLLASDNYRDWIKISEMFLGPAHKDFRFEPKHKSNAYEIEGEG